MANRIKGITVEIGGDTTGLDKALKGVNGSIKNTQTELRDVERLLKFDPKNTELLKQKQDLLKKSVGETADKLKVLKEAEKQVQEQVKKGEVSQEQYRALKREIEDTEISLKNLKKEAKESSVFLAKLGEGGEKLKETGNKISETGKKLSVLSGVVSGLGTIAIKTAADFDTAMSKVSAVSGATGKDLEALTQKAREMGEKTKFSASEAAEAMNYMAMAGWKTSDMISGIEGIMYLAAASGEDLATSSDIVTDALTAFGKSAKSSTRLSDIMAAASSNANTNVKMMGETFKYVASVAGSYGYSMEETAEMIGLMANAGIKSSDAGTALRSIMSRIATDAGASSKQLGALGILTKELGVQFYNADGTMRPFRDVINDTRKSWGKLTQEEQANYANKIAGKNAMSGWLALMQASEKDVKKLEESIDNCDGTAEKMAETMNDNLSGQLTILKSQLEELAISFGEVIMPVLRKVITFIQNIVDKLNNMDEKTIKLIETIAIVIAAIGPILVIAGKIATLIGIINVLMAASPTTWIILGIVAAVALLTTGIIALVKYWDKCWYGIKVAGVATANFFIGLVNTMLDIIFAPLDLIFKLLNQLPGVNLQRFQIPKINVEIEKPKMALGGILNYSSAIVGEAGAEVLTQTPKGTQVTPLNGATAKRALGGTLGEVVSEIRSLKKQMSKMQTTIKVGKREFGRVVRENV